MYNVKPESQMTLAFTIVSVSPRDGVAGGRQAGAIVRWLNLDGEARPMAVLVAMLVAVPVRVALCFQHRG